MITLKLDEAEYIAARLLNEGGLGKHFYKFKICGSIRRRKEEVNDIDIVAIPKAEARYEFGEESLSDFVDKHQKTPGETKLEKFLNGNKIKRFCYGKAIIDLYLADASTFETLCLIRTGSEMHNKRLATIAKGRGLKLSAAGKGLCKIKGGIYNNEPEEIIEIIETTERGILELLLGQYVEPEKREA